VQFQNPQLESVTFSICDIKDEIQIMKIPNNIKAIQLLCFIIYACLVACGNPPSNKTNTGKHENVGAVQTVSICRSCGLVVEYSYDRLFPDNSTIDESCNQWQGHLWYNAGTSGHNPFKCLTCGVKVSISEKRPRCMTFCDEACQGKAKHNWKRLE
jgi:hypothetical protein